ncbi:MAG: tetratricopeptide repeat protein [Bacteroidetes bacterium]|nr:tetratricopeptide repeat protein [Bacteroidota bacterium]
MNRLLLIIFLFPFFLSAQDRTIDSLKLALKNATHDTTRCNILNELAETASDEEWPMFNKQLLKLAEKGTKTLTSNASLKPIYLKHLASAYNNEGYISDSQGDITKALEYYHLSLKIQESINDKLGIANSLSNLGRIYEGQHDNAKASFYFHKSLKFSEEVNYRRGIEISLNRIGGIYQYQEDYNTALKYYLKSLKIGEEINNKEGIGYSLLNIGLVYDEQGDIVKALEYYYKSLKIREEIKDNIGITISLCMIGDILIKQGKLKEALNYSQRSLLKAQELGFPWYIKNSANTLKLIYQKQNKFKEALEMYELEIQMRDSINNTETKKASIKKQFQYEYEKKSAADSVKNAEEQKVKNALLTAQQAQLNQEKTQRIALYGGLVLVIAFLGFVFNRFRVTQKQKIIIEQQKVLVDEAFTHLEEKNKEVMDSIHYAKRIQTALLTSEKYIHRKLNELNS